MILYWKDEHHAIEYKLFNSLCGITYNRKRPSIVLLTEDEYHTLLFNPDLVLRKRGEEYFHTVIMKVTMVPDNVVIIRKPI